MNSGDASRNYQNSANSQLNSQMIANSGSNNPTQVFMQLDTNHKGYLNQSDVMSNSYLSGNFQRCDSNSDGRLTSDEVAGCMRNMPSNQQ